MAKKYFWLKLNEDFFNQKVIKKLRKIAGGDTFTIIYLEMQLLSLKKGGCLIYEGVEDDIAEELALDLNEDSENVKMTLAYLKSHGLIEVIDSHTYMLPGAIENTGKEGESAARMRSFRAKQKELTSLCAENVTLEKEIEIDKDKDKDIGQSGGKSPPDMTDRESLFEQFWKSYPKKVGKGNCQKWFNTHKPKAETVEQMIAVIKKQKESPDWKKEKGQFIPYPYKWLNGKRWLDEIETAESAPPLDIDTGVYL